jgi:hypothetical protein
MTKFRINLIAGVWLLPVLVVAQVRELQSPAGAGSGQPNLAVSPELDRAHGGGALLTAIFQERG